MRCVSASRLIRMMHVSMAVEFRAVPVTTRDDEIRVWQQKVLASSREARLEKREAATLRPLDAAIRRMRNRLRVSSAGQDTGQVFERMACIAKRWSPTV
jgi:hypothetical protein